MACESTDSQLRPFPNADDPSSRSCAGGPRTSSDAGAATRYGGDQSRVAGQPMQVLVVRTSDRARRGSASNRSPSRSIVQASIQCAIDSEDPLSHRSVRSCSSHPGATASRQRRPPRRWGHLQIKFAQHRGVGRTGANGMACPDADQLHGPPSPAGTPRQSRLTHTGSPLINLSDGTVPAVASDPQRCKFGVTRTKPAGCLGVQER